MFLLNQLKRSDPHLRVLTQGVFAGLLILLAGLWYVQVVRGRKYSDSQISQSFRSVRIPAVRGRILDRNGTVLAESRFSLSDRLCRAYGLQAGLLALLGEDLEAFYARPAGEP